MKRSSRYYPGCDGTKLAVDLYLPETEQKVPVIFQVMRNPRRVSHDEDPRAKEHFEKQLEEYRFFVSHGYAVCRLEPRGVGASYGTNEGFWSPIDGRDMAAVIDAVAAEDWCNGNAGMYGGSNVGASQHFAAMNQPKSLKCILPCDCSADFYYQNYPNGVSIIPAMNMPHPEEKIGIPVDDDPEGIEAAEALLGHHHNMNFLEQYLPNMHRDDVNPRIGYAPNMEIPLWEKMDTLRFGHTASYAYGAFYEPGCTNKVFEYRAFGGKLILGPWRHVEVYRPESDFPEGVHDWKSEHLKFFDHYLKGIANDIADEPPVKYYTTGDEHPWHYAADFPLDDQTNPELVLTPAGGISFENAAESGEITYTVRNDIRIFDGMGRLDRRVEKDLSAENEKCVLFRSEPLEKDLELTGFPVTEVYVTSTWKDGIFMAALQEETPDGVCHFLTDGMIRGRSQKISRHPILDPIGIPYHSSLVRDDVTLSPDKPTMLAFHLEALSRIVKRGSRLVLSLYCGGNGFNQPEGMPEDVKVTFHFGKETPSLLRLPVIRPNVCEFTDENRTVCTFKKAVYVKDENGWHSFPCLQVYPYADGTRFVTESFTAFRKYENQEALLTIEANKEGGSGKVFSFSASAPLPERFEFPGADTQFIRSGEKLMKTPFESSISATFRNIYVATVPVAKGAPSAMNPELQSTLDLYLDLVLPETKKPDAGYPCIVHIHGFGGNNHQFETISPELLRCGYALASIDYRLMPPNIWPSSAVDAKACIRYLKAHASELSLDPERFGVIGGSMGGHLSGMIAATNGNPADEGDIGGNTQVNSSVKAAVVLFPPTDLLTFGEDSAAQWPHQPDKVANGDGPFAPLASMIGYSGVGKGMGELKTHLYDDREPWKSFLELARDASSVSHVTKDSAPCCFVHGMFDCGIQVPMGQSLRMFEALTRAGVKSLCLLNNQGIYGQDPEVQQAMLQFLTLRV